VPIIKLLLPQPGWLVAGCGGSLKFDINARSESWTYGYRVQVHYMIYSMASAMLYINMPMAPAVS
jgi:hypothetical protein